MQKEAIMLIHTQTHSQRFPWSIGLLWLSKFSFGSARSPSFGHLVQKPGTGSKRNGWAGAKSN